MTRIIVAGSRKFDDSVLLYGILDDIVSNYKTDEIEIVSGGCVGADKIGEEYAESHGIRCNVFPALWHIYGKAAGPMRNEQMAKYAFDADEGILVAFPIGDSKGTNNMIKWAKHYGLKVRVIDVDKVSELRSAD